MTDAGQGGGRQPGQGLPPTPGDPADTPKAVSPALPLGPEGVPPPPPASIPPPAMPTFPGQDAATMRMMPTYHETPAVAPSPTGERRIGKYISNRELGRRRLGAVN